MRGMLSLSLLVLVPLSASCARGYYSGVGGAGTSSTTSAGGQGGASSGASSTRGASTGSTTSSSSTSGGSAPTTCAQADNSVGCCFDDTVYYCKSGETSLTVTSCSSGDVCGWKASSNYYTCVPSPGGADPSATYPITCP